MCKNISHRNSPPPHGLGRKKLTWNVVDCDCNYEQKYSPPAAAPESLHCLPVLRSLRAAGLAGSLSSPVPQRTVAGLHSNTARLSLKRLENRNKLTRIKLQNRW